MLSEGDRFYGIRLMDQVGSPVAEYKSNLGLDWSKAPIQKIDEGNLITGIETEIDIAQTFITRLGFKTSQTAEGPESILKFGQYEWTSQSPAEYDLSKSYFANDYELSSIRLKR